MSCIDALKVLPSNGNLQWLLRHHQPLQFRHHQSISIRSHCEALILTECPFHGNPITAWYTFLLRILRLLWWQYLIDGFSQYISIKPFFPTPLYSRSEILLDQFVTHLRQWALVFRVYINLHTFPWRHPTHDSITHPAPFISFPELCQISGHDHLPIVAIYSSRWLRIMWDWRYMALLCLCSPDSARTWPICLDSSLDQENQIRRMYRHVVTRLCKLWIINNQILRKHAMLSIFSW